MSPDTQKARLLQSGPPHAVSCCVHRYGFNLHLLKSDDCHGCPQSLLIYPPSAPPAPPPHLFEFMKRSTVVLALGDLYCVRGDCTWVWESVMAVVWGLALGADMVTDWKVLLNTSG